MASAVDSPPAHSPPTHPPQRPRGELPDTICDLSNISRHPQELVSEISSHFTEPRSTCQRQGAHHRQHSNQRWSPSFLFWSSPLWIPPTIRCQRFHRRRSRTLPTAQVGRGKPLPHGAGALLYHEDHRTKDSLCQTLRPSRRPVGRRRGSSGGRWCSS